MKIKSILPLIGAVIIVVVVNRNFIGNIASSMGFEVSHKATINEPEDSNKLFKEGEFMYNKMVKSLTTECMDGVMKKYGRDDKVMQDYCDCISHEIMINVTRDETKKYIMHGDLSWITNNIGKAKIACQ